MSLYATILADLTRAMKEQNAEKREVLRMVKTVCINTAIEKGEAVEKLDDAAVGQLLAKEAKKRRESIEQFRAGGRQDLAEKEQAELAILEQYLPEQMSPDEVRAVVEKIVAGSSTSEFGAVMGQAMGQLKGRADGAVVKKVVEEVLKA